jgi:hypothetical protein
MQYSRVQFLTNEGSPVEADVQGPLLVARGQRARFLVRLKCAAYRVESIVIDEDPSSWKIYDFNIHGRSQFQRFGDDEKDAVPGYVFAGGATNVSDELVRCRKHPVGGGLTAPLFFQTVQTAMNLWIDVGYAGLATDAPFVCTIRGTAAL